VTGWRDRAACKDEDPDLFHPSSPAQAEAAKLVCRRCPVRSECLDNALAEGDEHAIRGGLTRAERRDLPILDDVAGVLRAVAAVTVPPDPQAAEHRRVLLAELDAYEAAHPPGQRWGKTGSGKGLRRQPSGSGDARSRELRQARSEARRFRIAGLPVPEPVGELEREFWRTVKQSRRKEGRAA
jgi:WhiB family redox-sensing transcriptional regulator